MHILPKLRTFFNYTPLFTFNLSIFMFFDIFYKGLLSWAHLRFKTQN